MAAERKEGTVGGGLLELENELLCSICTDILYQPLALLDCLHSFCGSCLKEWFAWQATSAASTRRAINPYTCPSCRESVRDTKLDWRLTTLLEGFLKANPDRGKTDKEKEEMRKTYKPGDNVIPPIRQQVEDSEDERLMANARDLSIAEADSETVRRRAERTRDRRPQDRSPRHGPADSRRQEERNRRVVQQAETEQDVTNRHVEHQPSLRSLLSDSDISSEDVQQEILESIYQEGILNGIDVDNLTTQQEEELTERIAEAYRRRQRNRDRSRNHDRNETSNRSPRQNESHIDSPGRDQPHSSTSPPQQSPQPQSRARPPISRPHLFEQTSVSADRDQRRSASSSSHNRQRSDSATQASARRTTTQAARSATDLSQNLITPEQRPRASSSNARSTTDPANLRNDVQRVRNGSDNLRPGSSGSSSRPRSRDSEPTRRQTGPAFSSLVSLPASASLPSSSAPDTPPHPSMRPAASISAFAPEPVTAENVPPNALTVPLVSCSKCERQHIETKLHYHCSKCDNGQFNLCQPCYREGRGCHQWFGFGFMAMHNWQHGAPPESHLRAREYPHILSPRRYKALQPTQTSTTPSSNTNSTSSAITLQEGAFCELCSNFANDCYWYCEICLSGAWGYCSACVLRGKHCTHALLPLVHISALPNASHDPSKVDFLPVPHLRQHSYVLLPVLTDCDICRQPIHSPDPRYHCYTCGNGDYDICNTCYPHLVATGEISQANGPNGWRRCLQNHRMAIVGYRKTPYGGGLVRATLADPVGGWRHKEDVNAPPSSHPPHSAAGRRYLATWSWFPSGGTESKDELAFPQDAEIREGNDLNEDWAVGVYAGRVGVFPRNHTKKI